MRGLVKRVSKAHSLIFLRDENQLFGIAALKYPNANYRFSVFKKARVEASEVEYPLELGWVYVLPAGRGYGLSHNLVRVAVERASGLRIYATSRTDNHAMRKSLLAASFTQQGNEYLSTRGNYTLAVFTQEPKD